MDDQLVNQYLKPNGFTTGVYLVGWFLCDRWDKQHHQYQSTPKWSLERARDFFRDQASALSKNGISVSSFVLNCAANVPRKAAGKNG
ncbi:hypothetical protein PSR1_04037 [Anaeromyxobacter sp. PSR-1]|nr:hypothetical protein PSR1_04037 [Anaeromyxobacter sp. PSR-1]